MQRASLSAGSTVVEIGPGTGQATRHLAAPRTGCCCGGAGSAPRGTSEGEPGGVPAGQRRDGIVRVVGSRRGSLRRGLTCNSFHWIDPDIRFAKAAAVLRRGGHLVVLATPWVVPETADRFWWDVQDDWAAVGARSTRRRCIRTSSGMILHSRYGHPVCSRSRQSHADCSRSPSLQTATQPTFRRSRASRRCLRILSELIARIHQRVEGPRWARDRPSARRADHRPPAGEPVRVVVIADPRRSDNIAAGRAVRVRLFRGDRHSACRPSAYRAICAYAAG